MSTGGGVWLLCCVDCPCARHSLLSQSTRVVLMLTAPLLCCQHARARTHTQADHTYGDSAELLNTLQRGTRLSEQSNWVSLTCGNRCYAVHCFCVLSARGHPGSLHAAACTGACPPFSTPLIGLPVYFLFFF